MTTALDLISRSMRLLQVYAIGEAPDADESATALMAFNALLDSMPNSRELVYQRSQDILSLTASQASITVGPSGAVVTTRPVSVLRASFVRYQGVDYPLSIFTLDDFDAITVKTITGIPSGIYVDTGLPNVTVYPWPLPSAAMDIYMQSTKALTGALVLTTVLSLPPGYEEMLAFVLAEILAPEFQMPVPPDVAREAARARRVLKRTNAQIPRLAMPPGMPVNNRLANWRGF